MRVPDRALLAALLVVAAMLRFGGLDRSELWIDEAYSIRIGTAPAAETVASLNHDNKPPLYPFLLHVWLAVFGDSEVALRSLSATAGVLAVAVVWLLGVPLISFASARVAAVILALHPLAVHYSREGRNYSLLILLTFLVILALPRALETGSRSWWAIYAVSLSAALMVQYLAIALLPVSAVQLLVKREPGAVRRWAAWTGMAVAPLLLWFPFARGQRDFTASSLAWVRPVWDSWGPVEPVVRSFVMFIPGGIAPPWVGLPSSPALQPLVVAVGLATLVAFLFSLRDDTVFRRAGLVILGAIMIPLAILWVASNILFPIYIVGRADLIALPGFVLLLGSVITSPRSRLVSMAVGGLVAASILAGLVNQATTPVRNPESPALRPLAATLEDGDLVVCTVLTRLTAEYAVRRSGGATVRFVSYPEEVARHPAVLDTRSWTADYLEAEAEAIDDLARDTLRAGHRVFILMADIDITQSLRKKVETAYLSRTIGHYRLNREGTPIRVIHVIQRRHP